MSNTLPIAGDLGGYMSANAFMLLHGNLKDECRGRGLHMIHINMRSLNNKMELVRATFCESNASVITMSETWLNKSYSDSYNNIEGYTTVRSDREWDSNKKGGGICTYIKNGINYSESKFIQFNSNCVHLESQWISIKQYIGKEIIIINCYRPPQGDLKECLNYLNVGLNEIDLDKSDVFIIGDLNINFFDKKDKSIQMFNNSLKQKGFLQYIKEPTRITATTSTCIDLCYTNSNIVARAMVCNVSLSDHELILITRKKGPTIRERDAFFGRSYRNFDIENFKRLLSDHDWNELNNMNSPDLKWAYFHSVINGILDNLCPIKKFKISKVKQPWITPHLLELIKDKDYMLKKAKKTLKNTDLTELED